MLPCVCSVSHRSQMTSKCEKKKQRGGTCCRRVCHSFIMIVHLVKQVKLKAAKADVDPLINYLLMIYKLNFKKCTEKRYVKRINIQ